jgi:hypothetical protein
MLFLNKTADIVQFGASDSLRVTPGTNNSLHIASVHDGIFGYSNKLDKMKFPDGLRGRYDILLREP